MTLAIDSSTPAYVTTGGTASTSVTTANFTPPLGGLLVVLFSDAASTTQMTAPTNTGGAINWAASALIATTGTSCAASAWLGTVTTSASLTVTGNVPSSIADWGFGVVVVTGQAPAQTGATAATSGNPTDPSATIASLIGNSSLVVGAIANNTNSTVGTSGASQSQTFNSHAFSFSVGSTSGWAQYLTGMNLSAGTSATINDTAPSCTNACVVAEILAVSPTSSNATFAGAQHRQTNKLLIA